MASKDTQVLCGHERPAYDRDIQIPKHFLYENHEVSDQCFYQVQNSQRFIC